MKKIKASNTIFLYKIMKNEILSANECIAKALAYENGVENEPFSTSMKETMEIVCQGINEYLLGEEKIELSYLYKQKAPDGYFENLGKKILYENNNSLLLVSKKLVEAMSKYHDKMVPSYAPINYKFYALTKNDRCVESLPFYFGGIYLAKNMQWNFIVY